MNISNLLTRVTILLVIIFLPTSSASEATFTSTSENSSTISEVTETTEATEAITSEVPSTFTIYYQGNNSEITAESEVEIGCAFTLSKNSDSTFKGWYLFKEQDNQTLYYSYNATGELGWRVAPDVVAYYVFYNQDTISASDSKTFSSGESLYFRGLYAKHSIEDSVPSKWKGFEPYTAITNEATLNHYIAYGKKYQKSDGTDLTFGTKTDTVTGIRYVLKDNTRYYCVALGSFYGKVGSTHVVIQDNHVAFNVIVTDNKSVKDAVCKNVDGKTYTIYHNKSNVFPISHQHEYIEFVVDKNIVKKGHAAYKHGCLNVKYTIYNGNVKAIT